jgi:uncharacterized OsmC-like protein
MNSQITSIAKQRQDPLRTRYRTAPEEAWITDGAATIANDAEDPFHCAVAPGPEQDAIWPIGIHRAVGGYHDLPNPGDILCAALASCLHSTLRMIADRLEIPIAHLEVVTRAEVDVRGTLVVDRNVPVGFQKMKCEVRLEPAGDVPAEKMRMLLAAAEYSCVVLQTLRNGVQVELRTDPARSSSRLRGAEAPMTGRNCEKQPTDQSK